MDIVLRVHSMTYWETENEQYFQNASVIVNLTLFDLMVILI